MLHWQGRNTINNDMFIKTERYKSRLCGSRHAIYKHRNHISVDVNKMLCVGVGA